MTDACRVEHTVGNTVRKILHHVREEYNTASKGLPTPTSSSTSTPAAPAPASASSKGVFSIANFVLQGQPSKQRIGYNKASTDGGAPSGLARLIENGAVAGDEHDPDAFAKSLKPVLMEAIQDVLDELETVYDNVSKNAKNHIHSEYVFLYPDYVVADCVRDSEIILTLGHSKTVEAFLKAAAHHRSYTVIVAETSPS